MSKQRVDPNLFLVHLLWEDDASESLIVKEARILNGVVLRLEFVDGWASCIPIARLKFWRSRPAEDGDLP